MKKVRLFAFVFSLIAGVVFSSCGQPGIQPGIQPGASEKVASGHFSSLASGQSSSPSAQSPWLPAESSGASVNPVSRGASGFQSSTSSRKVSGFASSSSAHTSAPLKEGLDGIEIWTTPDSIPKNRNFSVWVRRPGFNWVALDVLTVQTGEQKENDVPQDAAFVNFDFLGTAELKIRYNRQDIYDAEVRPTALGLQGKKDDSDTLIYTLKQNESNPLKFVVMINQSWDLGNLHVTTNVPEKSVPKKTDPNVYVIKAGDEIPRQLPQGKDTYYFDEGTHQLPGGMWAELDLGKTANLSRFELVPANQDTWLVNGAQKFIIEAKASANDSYRQIYDGRNNTAIDTISGALSGQYRYIRLILLGNNAQKNPLANVIREFRLYESGSNVNIALSKAAAGVNNFENLTDGKVQTAFQARYTNWHSAESYFLMDSGTTVYLAKGAVVKGSFVSENADHITIRGRGILYGRDLLWPRGYQEGRSGAIWLIGGSNCKVEGITIIAYPMWTIVMNFSEAPVVRNVNIFNCMVNGDGIHFSGSSNGLVENCFIRACDDIFVMYHYDPGQNNLVKNSSFMADNARPILLGMGNTPGGHISNITFDQIHILNARGVWDLDKYNGAIQLWAGPGLKISNIRFRNMTIDEFEAPQDSCFFQIKTGNDNAAPGVIDGVTFENVRYTGRVGRKALIRGQGSAGPVQNVLFRNFTVNGQKLTNLNKNQYLEISGANGISFE